MARRAAPQLRSDAARNVERIVDAAYVVFASSDGGGAMEDVAAEAGVGIATVYRRFPRKRDLLRTVLERRWGDVMTPALTDAGKAVDPRQGIRMAFEGALRFVSNDRALLAAAAEADLMTMDLARRFVEPVGQVLRRGQREGLFREDLVEEDIPRLVLMLFATLPSFDAHSEGWRRYLDLVLDALTAQTTTLTPPSPVHDHQPNLPTVKEAA